MAGINRLGKAPPRPGSLRPPDPNKYRTMDMYSEGGENDADYMRMVQDIEDTQQNHVGWLFGRGAFDKGDLLYLRDEEEKKRFIEKDQRENERTQFLAMRARENAEREASLLDLPKAREKAPRVKQVAALIRVQPAKASAAQPAEPRDNADNDSQGPAAKRQRSEAAGVPASPAAPAQSEAAADVSLEELLGGYQSGSDTPDSPSAADKSSSP
ncbi:hypothetical protein WJX73_000138 [Symbiochloris irregularis]|uniref:Uncharacterized protein n=1 Tax=Symbiochloris irregularis TaxID=706552 RepID=A0AAW1PAI0_9CHLO